MSYLIVINIYCSVAAMSGGCYELTATQKRQQELGKVVPPCGFSVMRNRDGVYMCLFPTHLSYLLRNYFRKDVLSSQEP